MGKASKCSVILDLHGLFFMACSSLYFRTKYKLVLMKNYLIVLSIILFISIHCLSCSREGYDLYLKSYPSKLNNSNINYVEYLI